MKTDLEILKEVYVPGKNCVISHVSAEMALGLANTITYLPGIETDIDVDGDKMVRLNHTKKATLKISNSGWFRDLKGIPEWRAELGKEYYDAKIAPLDSVEEINRWVNDATQGMIPEIIQALDPRVAQLIVSCLYFKGEWRNPFS